MKSRFNEPEARVRLLHEAMTHVGLYLFQQKIKHGNEALHGLSISYFQAFALADLGNFFYYASTQISPDWPSEKIIDVMARTGWFDGKGLGLLTIKELEPFLQPQSGSQS